MSSGHPRGAAALHPGALLGADGVVREITPGAVAGATEGERSGGSPLPRRERQEPGSGGHLTTGTAELDNRTAELDTGAAELDADFFMSAIERLARQTPTSGVQTPPPGTQTPSPGLPVGTVEMTDAEQAAPRTAPEGAPANYPRRRDLRRQSASPITGPIPTPEAAPAPSAGATFVPAQARTTPCSGEIPLGASLPRRRDLRPGSAGSRTGTERTATGEKARTGDRSGGIAVGVARAAVVTMLLGAGYAVVSGHQLDLDGVTSGDTGLAVPDSVEAMLAAGTTPGTNASTRESEWDVRDEVSQVKKAAAQVQADRAAAAREAAARAAAVRAAAARAAAIRVQAAKASAAARAAALGKVTRDAQRDPKAVARLYSIQRGWGSTQFTCLDLLWTRESGWNYRATNPSSGAYGIPQSLPGRKMSEFGSDWRTNPVTQIKWGLDYIAERYGTPCGAWSHSQASGWY